MAEMSESERLYLEQRGPVRHAQTSRLVDICMRISRRKCTGGGCDERPCPRHARAGLVAMRYARLAKWWHV